MTYVRKFAESTYGRKFVSNSHVKINYVEFSVSLFRIFLARPPERIVSLLLHWYMNGGNKYNFFLRSYDRSTEHIRRNLVGFCRCGQVRTTKNLNFPRGGISSGEVSVCCGEQKLEYFFARRPVLRVAWGAT